MALKRKISSSDFEKLSKDVQAEYKKSGEDYLLDIDGDDDVGELRRAKDRIAEENRTLKTERNDYRTKYEELRDSAEGRRGEDIRTLENSWKQKLIDAKELHKTELVKRDKFIEKVARENVASEIAGAISKAPKLLLPHILPRITVDMSGDEPATRFLDKDGKISALTADDIKKEFAANADFAAIITATKASGSGGAGNSPSLRNGGAMPTNDGQPVMLSKLAPGDLAARITAAKQQAQ